VYGATRKEAPEKLRELQQQLAAGMNIAADQQTVAELLDRWQDSSYRRPRTVESYELTIRLHIKPYVGAIQLRKLRPTHVQKMVKTLTGKGLGARSVEYAVLVLRRALNWAVRLNEIATNPAQYIDTPPVLKRQPIVLTPEQARKLLDAVKGHPLELILRLALSLGMRKGEVLGLLRSDVDLASKRLTVTGTLQRVKGELIRGPVKSDAGERVLHIPDVLAHALARHIQQRGALRPDDYLFVHNGKPVEPRRIHDLWKAALERAGLDTSMHLHDARHSAASWMIAAGVHARVVQGILGHAHIATTMNIYGHVMEDASRDATGRLDRLLGGDTSDDEEPEDDDDGSETTN
jgi:integrase